MIEVISPSPTRHLEGQSPNCKLKGQKFKGVELVQGREKMAMTTIQADASQTMFEFLHSELVAYLQKGPPGSDKVKLSFRGP